MSNADLVTFFSLARVWRGKRRLVVSPFTLDRPGASWIVSWRTQKELAARTWPGLSFASDLVRPGPKPEKLKAPGDVGK